MRSLLLFLVLAVAAVAVVAVVVLREDDGGAEAPTARTAPEAVRPIVRAAPKPAGPAPVEDDAGAAPPAPEPLRAVDDDHLFVNAPPPPSQPFATGRITGRLLDAQGDPVARAMLDLRATYAVPFLFSTLALPVPSARSVRARSGSDGRFVMDDIPPDTDLRLEADTPVGARTEVSALRLPQGATLDVGDVRLAAVSEVTGRVIDHTGQPVPDAEILSLGTAELLAWMTLAAPTSAPDVQRVGDVLASLQERAVAVGRSDAEGQFRVTLPPDAQLVARAKGLVPVMRELDDDRSQPVVLAVFPARGRIGGRVRLQEGGPVPPGGAVIAMPHPDALVMNGAVAQVDADGRFLLIGLVDCLHDLDLMVPGHDLVETRRVPCGTLDVELVLEPRCPMEIGVKAAGVPVLDFELVWRRMPGDLSGNAPEDPWQRSRASAATGGVVRLQDAVPGWYVVQARAPDGGCTVDTALRLSNACPAERSTLVLGAPRALHGRALVAGTGTPLADVLMDARSHGPFTLPSGYARSGADGSFELDRLPEGELQLRASRPGYLPVTVRLKTGTPDDFILELAPAAAVHVRPGPVLREALALETAARHPRAELLLVNANASAVHTVTLQSWGAVFGAIAPGPWRLMLKGSISAAPLDIIAATGALTAVEY
jgi:hypothetical protein